MHKYVILGFKIVATKVASIRSLVCVDYFMSSQQISLEILHTKCTLKGPDMFCTVYSCFQNMDYLNMGWLIFMCISTDFMRKIDMIGMIYFPVAIQM